jgi:endonuclease YncB( thermonuclease family)
MTLSITLRRRLSRFRPYDALQTIIWEMSIMTRLLVAAFAVMFSGVCLADIVGRASVIDGDTIEIHGQRVRFHGVDAPEKGQPCFDAANQPYRCGQKAAMALDEFIGPSPVSCREKDVDRYGRIVATCQVRGEDIELWLVRSGHAFAYRRYSSDYIGAEQEAKNNRRGMWAGYTQAPWEWRKEQRHSAR